MQGAIDDSQQRGTASPDLSSQSTRHPQQRPGCIAKTVLFVRRAGWGWEAAVERRRPIIENANTVDEFEQSMSELLAELQTSHIGFFRSSARRASSRAALSATYLSDETNFGKRGYFKISIPEALHR
jgi:hypothetical protein